MKLLIPISYFYQNPESEIWQIDTETKSKKQIFKLPKNPIEVAGKGITAIKWLNKNEIVACDFNRLIKIKKNKNNHFEILKVKTDEEFNDLHSLFIHNEKILVANTGRDSIDIFDFQFNLIKRYSMIGDEEFQKRKKGDYQINNSYYDKPSANIPFHKRKVPDTFHLNHILQHKKFGNLLIANCFEKKCLINIQTKKNISNILPHHFHDGLIDGDHLWLTTVNGGIYKSKLEVPFHFRLVMNLFDNTKHHGWCRGLLLAENKIFVGITVLYEKSERTQWLKQDIEKTRSGIYQINLEKLSIEYFYDLSHKNGARIFSILRS